LCKEQYTVDNSPVITSASTVSCKTSAATSRGQHSQEEENVENTTGRKHAVHQIYSNPLNAELKTICHLLALLGVHFLHVSRIRVKSLTVRLLMSYIHIWSTYS